MRQPVTVIEEWNDRMSHGCDDHRHTGTYRAKIIKVSVLYHGTSTPKAQGIVLGIGMGSSPCRVVATMILHTSSTQRGQNQSGRCWWTRDLMPGRHSIGLGDGFGKHVGVCACIYYKVQSTSTSQEPCRSAVSTSLYPAQLGPWFDPFPNIDWRPRIEAQTHRSAVWSSGSMGKCWVVHVKTVGWPPGHVLLGYSAGEYDRS